MDLADPKFNLIVVACLVKRLGSPVVITQKEFDQIAYKQLIQDDAVETSTGVWALRLSLQDKRGNG